MKISWKLLLAPVFALFVLSYVDKAFLLPEVRDRFLQPGGMVYYKQRERQIDRMREYAKAKPPDIHLAVVLGDSRSFAIGNLPAQYIGRKNWKIFNFAGPQANPAYFYYLSRRLFTGLRRPGYMILEVSPESFNRNTGILGTTILNHGIAGGYMEPMSTMIPQMDKEAYNDTRAFAFYGLPFSLREAILRVRGSISPEKKKSVSMFDFIPIDQMEKGFQAIYGPAVEWQSGLMMSMKNAEIHNLDLYSMEQSHEVKFLNLMNGAQYAWFGTATDAELKSDTDRIAGIYLKRFQVSEEQVVFFERTLDAARAAGVKVIVFWPQVNPYLETRLNADPRFAILKKRIADESKDRGAVVLDMSAQEETRCKNFYDASHLSIQCFPAITGFLLDRLEKVPSN